MDDLETIRQRALDAAKTAPPPPVPPPTLEDVRAQALAASRLQDPKIREAIFNQRQQRLQQPITATPGQTVAAEGLGAVAGLVKGLFSPVSSFLPDSFNDKMDAWEEDGIRKASGMINASSFKATYQATPRTTAFLTRLPSSAGELAGSIPSLEAGFGTAKAALGVKDAFGAAKLGKNILAAMSAGGALSAGMKLDPGESRWATVATNSLTMGAFELVGVPAMMKAWKEETPTLAEKIAPELHGEVTAIRAGVPASDTAIDAVINAAKKDPAIKDKPVVLQAVKQKVAKQAITPKTTIDPMIESSTLGARITVSVDGVPQVLDIAKDATNPQHFTTQVDNAVSTLRQIAQTGADFKVDSLITANAEDAKAVLDSIQGKKVTPAKTKKTTKVPGAAPAASVAENGPIPSAGQTVMLKEDGKPPVKVTVTAKTDQPTYAYHDPMTGEAVYRTQTETGPTDLSTSQLDKRGISYPPAPARDDAAAKAARDAAQARQPASKALADVQSGRNQPVPSAPVSDTRMSEISSKYGGGGAASKADAYAMAQSTLDVEMPDKTVKTVPLANVQVPLEVGVKQSEKLVPHLDGSDRRGIIHVDSNEVSYEPLGGSREPQQDVFQGPMFEAPTPDIQWGNDPRLTIHQDGVTITPTTDEEVHEVTRKRAAKVLISNGVDPSTVEKSTGKTLKEVAETSLPLANLEKLQDDAAERGLTATPYAEGVTLTSPSGFSRTFANSLEAHEAVLRMNNPQVDRKIEAELEAQWRMGSERAWDPDVDVNKYLPLHMQEAGVQDLATGKKPLALVYTKSPRDVNTTIRALETSIGVPENTFKVQLLPAMDDGERKAVALYNQDSLALQAAKYRDSLNYLGVSAKDPGDVLRQLSTKPHGIYVLAGRDAESAALYSRYRSTGAKELWEKGRLETDNLGSYRRFSKAQKSVVGYPGAGDEFYPDDMADIFSPPEGVKFTPDSINKPRMAEEMPPYEPDLSFGSEPPRWKGGKGGNLPGGEFKDTSGPVAKVIGLRFRPTMELFKDLQSRTDVPYYEWYRAIEVGRNKVEQTINPYLSGLNDLGRQLNRQERKEVTLLLEARVNGTATELEKKVSDKVQHAATSLQQAYHDFFSGEGYSSDDVIDFIKNIPDIRAKDGNFKTAMKGRPAIPRITRLLQSEFENGTLMIDSRELDFQRIAARVMRSTATERYLMPSWNRAATEMQAFAESGRIPGDYANHFTKYMDEVLHMPDDLQKSLSRATKQVFSKMGMKLADSEAQDAVQMLTQMNYFANLAWKPGIVLRDVLQTLQTSLPIIGSRDTLEGWRFGLKWYKDPKLQEDMVTRGIIQPNGIYAPMQEVANALSVGGKTGQVLDTVFNKGTKWNAEAHNFSHVVAYRSQYVRALRVGQEYLDKKIDFQTFLEKSKLDMRDAQNGPFHQELRGLLDSGRLEKAASRAGEEFAKSTQYVYTRGNAPYVMQSTLGRFLLQYGTWPSWYAENLRNMVARGSWKNRTATVSRWLAVQGAMFGTANALFGVDLARWTFFSPLGYTGGPAAQLLQQGSEAFKTTVDTSSNDPVARIDKARFAKSAAGAFVPVPIGSARDVIKAMQNANKGNWADAAKAFLGLQPVKQ